VARNDREVQALVGDKHAWVGLPVGVETNEDYRLKLKQAEPENVVRLKSKSPYNAPVVNWDKFEAISREEKKKRKAQIARNAARNAGLSSTSGSASGSGTESGGESGAESGDYSAEEDENDGQSSPKSRQRPMNEKKLVKKMEKFGYDAATMDPFELRGIARLGTYSYDIHTGRRIRHKGNNRWIGANDPTFEVQYELPPQAAVAQEENDEDFDQEKADIVAELGEGSLTTARPKVFYHRSGAVTVSNPSLLNKKSRFLREHRSMFLDNYTHHNLSDYSGLLSSTYFDLTVHAQGLRPQGSIAESAADDDLSEFNYVQAPVPLAKTKTGFSQSFLTESAAGLARSKTESRLYPASNAPADSIDGGLIGLGGSMVSYDSAGVPTNVRFTADGTPIRGARKPYSRGAAPSAARPLMPYASVTESYRGQPGSYLGSDFGAATGPNSRKSVLTQNSQSQLDVSGASDMSGAKKWKTSAWGKLKQGVEGFNEVSATDPTLRNKVFQAALQGSLASSSASGLEDVDLDFTGAREQSSQVDEDSVDSDEEMWRSRALYKPNKNYVNKLGVWPRPPAKHYKLRYTWIPQPLLHNAVNNLYHEKTVWEYRKDASESNTNDFKKEILQGKASYQRKVEKSTMLSIVDDSNTSSRQESSSRRANTSASLVGFGTSHPAGILSPTEGSISSSKYYKHFVRDSQAGSPTQLPGVGESPDRLGHGGSVMITQLEDDESSLGSGSMHEESASPTMNAAQQRQLFKKGSDISFSLRSGNGKSATYDVVSVGSRTPARSRSVSPSGRASPGPIGGTFTPSSPEKQLAFQFPSPKPTQSSLMGMQVGMNEFDMNSLISSPGASVTAGMESPGGAGSLQGSNSGWESAGGAPTSAFYSAKITSRSASKLVPHKEADDAEFNHGLSSGAYHAEKPHELTKEEHARALFVEKRSTTPKDLRANHYLPKQQRVTIKEPTDDDAHYILPNAPADSSPSAGGTSKKFRFKPPPTRDAPPPPTESPSAKLQGSSAKAQNISSKINFAPTAGASAGTGLSAGSQKLMHQGSVGSIKRPPPPSGPPPDFMLSSSSKVNTGTAGESGKVASPKSTSKKLTRGDSIHQYHFL